MATRTNNAATAAQSTYRNLISRTKEEVSSDARDAEVAQAETSLEMGILSVKRSLIDAEKALKEETNKVSRAEANIQTAIASVPFNVQAILNARTAKLQAEANIVTKQAEFDSVEEAYNYLIGLRKELFPA